MNFSTTHERHPDDNVRIRWEEHGMMTDGYPQQDHGDSMEGTYRFPTTMNVRTGLAIFDLAIIGCVLHTSSITTAKDTEATSDEGVNNGK